MCIESNEFCVKNSTFFSLLFVSSVLQIVKVLHRIIGHNRAPELVSEAGSLEAFLVSKVCETPTASSWDPVVLVLISFCVV